MGSGQGKGETDAAVDNLSPLYKFMTEQYPGSLSQVQKWVELGFPAKGSLSSNQLEQLKIQLRKEECMSAVQHFTLSKRKQQKNEVFKADWKAFRMWRKEANRREKQRTKTFGALKSEKPIDFPETNMLYPSLSETPRKPVDLDLDSAPPIPPPYLQPPPVYTPVTTRLQSQLKLKSKRGSPGPASPGFPTVTMPMVEVAGVKGPMLVFRPWSETDVEEAMMHVCSPKDNLKRWEADLIQFVREFRPTMFELRRLMSRSLGNDYHKIQSVFTPERMACHLADPNFEGGANGEFVSAVQALIDAVSEKFPLRLNLSAITTITQGPQETCSTFLARLTSAFDVHSGLTRPDLMGVEPLNPYEVHLKGHFLSRMRPELVQVVKKSCVIWKTCPLSTILQHAEHAEEQLQSEDELKKNYRQKKLEDGQLAMFNAYRSVEWEPEWGGPEEDPSACHFCGRRGHWQAECPEIFGESD